MIFTITPLNISQYKQYTEFESTTIEPRCVGYYFKLEDAISAVENNVLDIHETNFNFVVIESCSEGLYPIDSTEQYWFEWNREHEKYVSCERPEEYKSIIRIGIG